MLIEYIRARPCQLTKAIDDFPLALVPYGSLEWHGPHLPLGFDGLKAESLLRLVGERLQKGVLFPTRYWGAFDTIRFPYTFHYPRYNAKKDVIQLYRMGFRMMILLTGHYPVSQVKNLRRASLWLMRKKRDAFVLGIPEHYLLQDLNYHGDHAGAGETALSLALFPESTSLSLLAGNCNYRDRVKNFGIMGPDPCIHASVEFGQGLVETFVSRMVEKIEATWSIKSQKPFRDVFRIARKNINEFKKRKNLNRTLEILGMDSVRDIFWLLKWQFVRRIKGGPDRKGLENQRDQIKSAGNTL
ncbi:MAG: creatininase family protein [Promethearchaeota archaeon]